MVIQASDLKTSLENNWLVVAGGNYPDSVQLSGQKFAQAVAQWFALAQANGFPCSTAISRQGQLALQAASALQIGQAQGAASQLALAIATYYTGQSFGSGVASFPIALPTGISAISSVFFNLELSNADRAQQIATACYAMAVSTIVIFPNPPFAGPIS
jgi:hypothetical protein